MDRRHAFALLRLVQDDDEPPRRPLALVGRGAFVDAFARTLLAGGGDRRALAPLPAAAPAELAGCAAVVACGLSLAQARLVAAARRPWVAALAPGDDRHLFGALPHLGAWNAVPPLDDGTPDVATALARLAARLERLDAVVLAQRLPALVPATTRAREAVAARRAGGLALAGRPGGSITLTQALALIDDARSRGSAAGPARLPEIATAIGAGLLAREAGRRLPSRFVRAALAYGVTRAVLRCSRAMLPSR